MPLDNSIERESKMAADFLQRRKTELLKLIGIKVLSMQQQDFQKKSRGGAGADGKSWKPLAASTIAKKSRRGKKNAKRKTTKGGKARPGAGSSQIGVDTGLLRASASPGFSASDGKGGNVFNINGQSVTVGYARDYAKYFDEKRPLMPAQLPTRWQDEIEKLIGKEADRILKATLGK